MAGPGLLARGRPTVVRAISLRNSRWASARWLVIAPHPDDETLGTGALIAEASASGRLAAIVYLTDGSGSHPAATARLSHVRRGEAAHALRRLSGRETPTCWMGWRDAHPSSPDDPAFLRSAGWLGALLRRLRVDAVAVTALSEPHCDHAAAHGLARAARIHARREIGLFSYHVWSKPPECARRAIRTAAMPLGRRVHALRAHRSQLSPSMGPGFRLLPEQRRMAGFDILFPEQRR